MSNNFKKYNNYTFDKNTINEVIQFIKNKTIPQRVLSRPITKGYLTPTERFILKYKDFKTKNGKLYVNHKEVILKEEVPRILETLYQDDEIGMGKGIDGFYKVIRDRYIGVSKKVVETFLKKQPEYQLQQPVTGYKINKPIVTQVREPNDRWAMDLVEIQRYSKENSNHRYILTVIDFYSRYAWAEPMKTKKPEDVLDAFDTIILQVGGYPSKVQHDNGGEFKGAFKKYLNEHNVKKIVTQSYTPQSNGLIERFNKELRKLIGAYLLRYTVKTKKPTHKYIDGLTEIMNNYNNTINGTTGYSPYDLYNKTDMKVHEEVKDKNIQQAKKIIEANTTREFEVGDLVRVKLTKLSSEIRKKIKAKDTKYIVVTYTPEVYKVASVSVKNKNNDITIKQQYTIKKMNGDYLLTQRKLNDPNKKRHPMRLFATDLQAVDPEEENIVITQSDADQLNRIKSTVEDVNESYEDAGKPPPLEEPPEPKETRSKKQPNKKLEEDPYSFVGMKYRKSFKIKGKDVYFEGTIKSYTPPEPNVKDDIYNWLVQYDEPYPPKYKENGEEMASRRDLKLFLVRESTRN